MPRISKGDFKDIISYLMWISRDTLDKGEYLSEEEYVEAARKILDIARVDYTTLAGH